jgi:hypothetical protein
MRRLTSLVAAALLVLAVSPSATAITFGEPDRTGHPNVGALFYVDRTSDEWYFACTGSLLAEDQFLTATHCTPWDPAVAADMFVTFDAELPLDLAQPATVIGLDASNPMDVMSGFWLPPSGAQSRNDVAVLHLAEDASDAYPGIEPIDLPSTWYLRDAAARGGLVGQSFTNVGYGLQSGSFVNRNTPFEWNGLRMTSTSPYLALTRDHLVLLENPRATGEGGVCTGDSGGPNFMGAPGTPLGNLAVSLNVGRGYHDCDTGMTTSQRLDLPEVLGFLAPYFD